MALDDLIDHIRADETQLQVSMAKAAVWSTARTACDTIPHLHDWFQVRFRDSEIKAMESVKLARMFEGRDWGDETWQNTIS